MTPGKTLTLWILTTAISYAMGMAFGFGAAGNNRPGTVALILIGFYISGFLTSVGYQSILGERLKLARHYTLSIKQFLPALGITVVVLLLNIPIFRLGNESYNSDYSLWSIMAPVFVGVITGVGHWFFIFKPVNGSGWWILIFTLSLIVGMNIGFYVLVFFVDVNIWVGHWFISGAIFGLIIGASTGATSGISILGMLAHGTPAIKQDALNDAD